MKAEIVFYEFVQDSQDYGSDDEHMVSRVYFDLSVSGTKYSGLYANIKQIVGARFESDPFEVSNPVGYSGAFNHDQFQNVVEAYVRSLFGSTGSALRLENCSNIRLMNSRYFCTASASVDVSIAGGAW